MQRQPSTTLHLPRPRAAGVLLGVEDVLIIDRRVEPGTIVDLVQTRPASSDAFAKDQYRLQLLANEQHRGLFSRGDIGLLLREGLVGRAVVSGCVDAVFGDHGVSTPNRLWAWTFADVEIITPQPQPYQTRGVRGPWRRVYAV